VDHYPDIHTRELLRRLAEARVAFNYAAKCYEGDETIDIFRRIIERYKETLSTREHIPSKAESKKIRQDAARLKRRL